MLAGHCIWGALLGSSGEYNPPGQKCPLKQVPQLLLVSL
jgi:hypothetical protein